LTALGEFGLRPASGSFVAPAFLFCSANEVLTWGDAFPFGGAYWVLISMGEFANSESV
jgi:hypothetical protein